LTRVASTENPALCRVLRFSSPQMAMAAIGRNNFQRTVDYVMRIAIICIS